MVEVTFERTEARALSELALHIRVYWRTQRRADLGRVRRDLDALRAKGVHWSVTNRVFREAAGAAGYA